MFTVVRHMEVDWNFQERFTAQTFHLRLNKTGIAEAERMALRLEPVKFQAIYSSDQLRAVETALIIAGKQEQAKRFVIDPRLREVNVGSLVGDYLKKTDFKNHPEFSTRHPNFDYHSVGGESKADAIERLSDFFDEKAYAEGNIEKLIVGHGTALRIILEHYGITQELTRENFIRLKL